MRRLATRLRRGSTGSGLARGAVGDILRKDIIHRRYSEYPRDRYPDQETYPLKNYSRETASSPEESRGAKRQRNEQWEEDERVGRVTKRRREDTEERRTEKGFEEREERGVKRLREEDEGCVRGRWRGRSMRRSHCEEYEE